MSTPPPKALTPAITSFIQEIMQTWKVVGLQMCAVLPSGEVEYAAFGEKDDEGGKVDLDTHFGIASCSKAFCCFALSQLMQDYRLGRSPSSDPSSSLPALPNNLTTFSWHTPISLLLPPSTFQLSDPELTKRVTLLDCVAHVTGLAAHDLLYSPGEGAEEAVKRLRYLEPNRGLREEWQYNNLMYMAAQLVIPTLTGIPYTQFLQDRIFDPLGMDSTTFSVSRAQQSGNFTQGFTFVGPGKDMKRAEGHFVPDEGTVDLLAGAGGILSNVKDMAKWIKALLSHGLTPDGDTSLLADDLFSFITSGKYVSEVNGSLFPEVSAMTYGGGWWRYSLQGHEIYCHTGGTPGISAYTFVLPNDNLGLCFLCNTGARQLALRAIAHRLIETLLDLPQIDWSTRYLQVVEKQENALRSKIPPRCADATPPKLELAKYCGTYKNAAYGSFTLHGPGSSPSQQGDALLSAFAAVNSSPSAPFPEEAHTTPQLYATFEKIWCNALRFRHREGETWAVTGEKLYPEGWGAEKEPWVRVWGGEWEGRFVLDEEGGKVKGCEWMEGMIYTPQIRQEGDGERTIWFERMPN